MTRICLCAIFRNEEKNVRRCLDAAKPIVDYISICDTGSTDDTTRVIVEWARENDVPAKVHKTLFRDFGSARSESVTLAKSSFPDADYLLLLDADLKLEISQEFKKEDLDADCYLLEQKTPHLQYWNIRLIKTALDWICEGVTHEYWNATALTRRELLTTLWIDDLGDGGYKEHKFERDRELLTQALSNAETPQHLVPRYLFYLAQTHRDMGNWAEAFNCYVERINAGGWDEEIFASRLGQAQAAAQLGYAFAEVVRLNLEAFAFRPTRAEPLWQLAVYCRERGRYPEGYVFAKAGVGIPIPADILFVRTDIYIWRMLDELSVCASWAGHYLEALQASEKLILECRYPPEHEQRIRGNYDFAKSRVQ